MLVHPAGLKQRQESSLLAGVNGRHAYFVHSYRATEAPENRDWVLATSEYGGDFVSAVKKGEVRRISVLSSRFLMVRMSCEKPCVLAARKYGN